MTYQDLTWLREQAIQVYGQLRNDQVPAGSPYPETSEGERRMLAMFEASVRLLARQGLLGPGVQERDLLGLQVREFGSVFDGQ